MKFNLKILACMSLIFGSLIQNNVYASQPPRPAGRVAAKVGQTAKTLPGQTWKNIRSFQQMPGKGVRLGAPGQRIPPGYRGLWGNPKMRPGVSPAYRGPVRGANVPRIPVAQPAPRAVQVPVQAAPAPVQVAPAPAPAPAPQVPLPVSQTASQQ